MFRDPKTSGVAGEKVGASGASSEPPESRGIELGALNTRNKQLFPKFNNF
jgi:hypothetical protein